MSDIKYMVAGDNILQGPGPKVDYIAESIRNSKYDGRVIWTTESDQPNGFIQVEVPATAAFERTSRRPIVAYPMRVTSYVGLDDARFARALARLKLNADRLITDKREAVRLATDVVATIVTDYKINFVYGADAWAWNRRFWVKCASMSTWPAARTAR